jgi:hypothetical protein
MTAKRPVHLLTTSVIALTFCGVISASPQPQATHVPLALASGRVSIAGTSNVHDYTASTTKVRIVRLQFTDSVNDPTDWNEIVKPGAIESFEVAIAAASLTSPREGLDKNMYKALKVTAFPDITFRLNHFDATATTPGTLRATGVLTIAGVEREVALDLKTQRSESSFTVKGEIKLLMTDYGIAPPKAMLGMLKTDPAVTVSFETVLAIPRT